MFLIATAAFPIAALAVELAEGPPRWVDDWDVPVGVADLALADGFVFPVHDDAQQPAGFVFVGNGGTTVALAHKSEALALAEGLVVAGVDKAAAVQVYRDVHLRESFDIAIVLTKDAAINEVVAGLPALVDTATVSMVDAQGRHHLIVTELRPRPAANKANDALRERAGRLAAAGLDPNVLFAEERYRPASAPRLLAEVHTSHSWLPMREPSLISMSDRWLTFSRDPTGTVDDAHTDVMMVHGLAPGERVTHRVLTGSGPRPDRGATVSSGAVNVIVRKDIGMAHAVRFEAILDVARTPGERLLPLAIPRGTEAFVQEGVVTVLGDPVIEQVATLDGKPLERLDGLYGRLRPEGSWEVATYVLAPGLDPVRLRITWTDKWTARRPLEVGPWALDLIERWVAPTGQTQGCTGGCPEWAELGRVAEHKAVVPILPHRAPAPTHIRVGTALGGAWKATIGADTGAAHDSADGRWWSARTVSSARVSFGDFTEHIAPAVGSFPAVRVLEHRPTGGGSAVFVRALIHFYRSALPPYPHAQLAVVQGPDVPTLGRFVDDTAAYALRDAGLRERNVPTEVPTDILLAVAPAHVVLYGFTEIGVAGSQSYERMRASAYPNEIERRMAHAVAVQWTKRPDAGQRDAWIGDAAAVYLRDRFLEEAYGQDVAAKWDQVRDAEVALRIGHPRVIPLAAGRDPWLGEIGGERLAALASRIGEGALLEGLAAYLQGPDPSAAAFVADVSRAAGIDVGPFVDAWLLAGVQPKITGTYHLDQGELHISLISDIAMGRIPIPIGVTTRRGTLITWVDLNEGVGTVKLYPRGDVQAVALDPDGHLAIRGALARR